MEERRPAAPAGGASHLEELNSATMESADAGSAEPLLKWILASTQASCAGLFYAHRDTGRLSLAFEMNLPESAPHELPPASTRRPRGIASVEARRQGRQPISFPGRRRPDCNRRCFIRFRNSPSRACCCLGWNEGEAPASLGLFLTAFSASHGALLREWQTRQQMLDAQRKRKPRRNRAANSDGGTSTGAGGGPRSGRPRGGDQPFVRTDAGIFVGRIACHAPGGLAHRSRGGGGRARRVRKRADQRKRGAHALPARRRSVSRRDARDPPARRERRGNSTKCW